MLDVKCQSGSLTMSPSSLPNPHWHNTNCPVSLLPPAFSASAFAAFSRYGLRAEMSCFVSGLNGNVSLIVLNRSVFRVDACSVVGVTVGLSSYAACGKVPHACVSPWVIFSGCIMPCKSRDMLFTILDCVSALLLFGVVRFIKSVPCVEGQR